MMNIFIAPNLSFNFKRNYSKLENIKNIDKNSDISSIKEFSENIKFKLDNKGGMLRVQIRALINSKGMLGGAYKSKLIPKYKNLILDRAYWLIMKRIGRKNPFFILGINNSKFMTPSDLAISYNLNYRGDFSSKENNTHDFVTSSEENEEYGFVTMATKEDKIDDEYDGKIRLGDNYKVDENLSVRHDMINNSLDLSHKKAFQKIKDNAWIERRKRIKRKCKISSDDIIGGLTKTHVERVIFKEIDGIRYCYEKEKLRNPKLKGNVEVLWKINPWGKVVFVKINKSSTLKNENVHRCMKSRIKRWKFLEPKDGGYAQVKFTFKFPY